MEEIAWDDDDVNAQSKFALQRARTYTTRARSGLVGWQT